MLVDDLIRAVFSFYSVLVGLLVFRTWTAYRATKRAAEEYEAMSEPAAKSL